jgi:hypothetical protein
MKKVCGTCNFNINMTVDKIGIIVTCAIDHSQHKDNEPACDKWVEYNKNLSNQDRLSLASSLKQDLFAEEDNDLAREANEIARDSNRIASSAKDEARLARIIAIIAATIAATSIIKDIIIWLLTKK